MPPGRSAPTCTIPPVTTRTRWALPSEHDLLSPADLGTLRGAVVVVLLWLGLGGNDSDMAAYMGGSNILV